MVKASFNQLFLYETIGMFVFMYGMLCFSQVQELDAQVSLVAFIAIVVSGFLCGANLNPAITLSNCIRKENKYTKKMFPVYFIAQFLGTFFALAVS